MQIIIESGANFNAANNDGETVLHIVAGNPSLRSGRDSGTKAKLLIDAGADIHAKSKSSKTPLAYAVGCECKAVEKVLRETGAA
jgi:ankyrin repeat protein